MTTARTRQVSAASHDQPTPIMVGQTTYHFVDSFLLPRPGCSDRTRDPFIEDRVFGMTQEVDPSNRRRGVRDGRGGCARPIACGDDPAHRVDGLLGESEKRVDVRLGDPGFRCVALALDGDPVAVPMPGYEVDSPVTAIQVGQVLPLWPVSPAMYLVYLVLGVFSEDPGCEVLKPPPLLTFVPALPTYPVQGCANGAGGREPRFGSRGGGSVIE